MTPGTCGGGITLIRWGQLTSVEEIVCRGTTETILLEWSVDHGFRR
ncbi:hypothetical protein EV644_12490 [Kribbella orskensis]|uniref:Uncharacterized protein n=1 Tax=Kribbella orskensis TaxID=2512216 RepID=A0ABY2BAL8_9ACTN|nr:hypothetical protein EV642_1269 [Kribbella sp. VKM Ac-2500]TCO12966.1 hypothetical protein EV644_12490 [Kribbella orskensis]